MDLPSPFHVISICTGNGAGDLALKLAVPSARTVLYVEREAHAIASLVRSVEAGALDDAPVFSDVRTCDGRAWRGRVDCLVATYPCQPFSAAGKRLGEADPRHLWPDIARIIREAEPPLVFLENVRNHLRLGFQRVCEDLCEMGYDTRAGLFSAAEAGAPHGRVRLFALAYARQSWRWGSAEPSGLNGTGASDHRRGTGGTLGDPECPRCDGSPWGRLRVNGPPLQTARPDTACGELAEPGCSEHQRGGYAIPGTPGGIEAEAHQLERSGNPACRVSVKLAISAEPGLPQRRHHAEDEGEAPGELPVERRGAELEHSPAEGRPGQRASLQQDQTSGRRPPHTDSELAEPKCGGLGARFTDDDAGQSHAKGRGAELAESASGGLGSLRKSPGGDGLTDGIETELVDSLRRIGDGPHRQTRSGRGTRGAGDDLERPSPFPPYRTGDWDRWRMVLETAPWLRPAMGRFDEFVYQCGRAGLLPVGYQGTPEQVGRMLASKLHETETQCLFRRVVDGVARQSEFRRERAHRIRAVGLGIVPVTMAFAFRVLAEAHGFEFDAEEPV